MQIIQKFLNGDKMLEIDIHWKQQLWNCYHHGKLTRKDDATVKELMGNYIFIEQPQNLPLPFKKEVFTTKEYMEGMKKGLYDIAGYPLKGEALYNYVNSFNDNNLIYCSDLEERALQNIDKKPFIYTYPERLMHSLYNEQTDPSDPDLVWENQIGSIIERLDKNIGSNRAVATLYHPGLDWNRTDIPCLNWLQATVRDNKLELHCMFRSNDLYGAWPSNMYLLTYLGLWLTENIDEDICFKGIHYHSSSLHIYEMDLDAVEKLL